MDKEKALKEEMRKVMKDFNLMVSYKDKCPHCGTEINEHRDYFRHISISTEERRLYCPQCKESVISGEFLVLPDKLPLYKKWFIDAYETMTTTHYYEYGIGFMRAENEVG